MRSEQGANAHTLPAVPPGDPRPLLTTREAGHVLGISERSVRRAISEGRLRAVRQGAVYRLRAADVEQFAEQRTTPLGTARVTDSSLAPAWLSWSRFIGRVDELDELVSFLTDPGERLLTLTGPGGIGKTRLALEAAGMMHHRLPDGVHIAFLETTRDPALVPAAIAQALGLEDVLGDNAVQRLQQTLQDARLLLVLDNFEHVLPAATEVAQLLAAAPGVRILVTSRAPLRLSAERVIPLKPMDVAEGAVTPASLQASDAGALFLDRAQRQGPLPPLDEETASIIAQICARVDGLPLGIELAAATTRLLTLPEVLQHLQPALPLLTDGPRDASPRHVALRNAIAWSYDLLSPAEQWLFRQLAVYVGGFSLDAVTTLAASATEPVSPTRALGTLIDHSLIRRDDPQGLPSRYTMLETIREFGLEQLAAAGELHAAQAAHATSLRARVADLLEVGSIFGRSAPLVWLTAEQANLRAALTWLQQQDPEGFVELAAALGMIWFPYRAGREGEQWLASALAHADRIDPRQHARLLIGQGGICFAQGRYAEIPALLDRATQLLSCAGNPPLDLAIVDTLRGAVFTAKGDYARAKEALERARVRAEQIPDATLRAGMIARTLGNLAVTARSEGRLEEARNLADAALERYAAGGFDLAMAQVQVTEGQVFEASGDIPRALQCWHEGLQTLGDHGDPRRVADTFNMAACACADRADWASALLLFGAAEGVRQREHIALSWRDRSRETAAMAAAEQTLGTPRAQQLLAAGQAMSHREALACLGYAAQRCQPALSPRQHEILALLADGRTDREIGKALFLSRRTVSWHVRTILDFFQVRTRGEAVARARAEGLLLP